MSGYLPGACLQTRPCRPRASTGEPHRQRWGTHKSSARRKPTATLTASSYTPKVCLLESQTTRHQDPHMRQPQTHEKFWVQNLFNPSYPPYIKITEFSGTVIFFKSQQNGELSPGNCFIGMAISDCRSS